MKYIFSIFAVTCIALALYFFGQTQFQLNRIYTSLGENRLFSDEERAFSPPPQLLDEIIARPLTYLDRGKQSFVFLSADKRFVVKFFDTSAKKESRLLSKLALVDKIWDFCADLLQNFESMCIHLVEKFCSKDTKKHNFSDQMEFRKKSSIGKIKKIVAGYLIAKRSPLQNGALVLVEPSPNPRLFGKFATLKDRFGFSHTIDLSKVPFIIQYKAIPTRVMVTEALQKGDVEQAKQILHKIFAMYQEEHAHGIYDRDHNFMYNTGFIGDKPVRIDLGRVREKELMKDPEISRQEMQILFKRLEGWLERHFPVYRDRVCSGVC